MGALRLGIHCLLAAGAALTELGCNGVGVAAAPELPPAATPSQCTAAEVTVLASPRRLRRLGDRELAAVTNDILGTPGALGTGADLIGDPQVDGWETDARAFVVSGPKLDGYLALAAKVAPAVARTAACMPSEAARDCAARFARTTATRAFGRPPTAEELVDLLAVYDTGVTTESADAGLRLLAEAILLAPSALYRSEIGVAGDGTEAKLTDWELASQISFLFSGSRPDDALLAAAERGELSDPKNAVAHAKRLLAMPRARIQIEHLVEGWLELGKLDATRRSKAFPELTPAVLAAMQDELHRLVDHVVFEGTGTLDELLDSSTSYPSAALVPIYGADLLATPNAGAAVPLDPEHRRGVLSLPAFLTGHASYDATNPVDRGLFVRTRLFCQEIGAPPAVAFTMPVVAGANDGTTTRQKFEQHSTDPLCKGCHSQMDPIGFGLEGFDAIGRFRNREHGLPVDDSGNLTDADVTGPFRGPAELAVLVSRSEDARTCFVAQVMRFAEGSSPSALCEVKPLKDQFMTSGRRITDLLLAYVARREFYV
ncbi:MAG: Cellulose-binding domain protein, partial [Myxococcaceae bacterium]|nr:Cellulose-binding domain protein [Myxococcaceae bacterium]